MYGITKMHIGASAPATNTAWYVTEGVTASATDAKAVWIRNPLTAAANSNVMYGVYVDPDPLVNGAYTGVTWRGVGVSAPTLSTGGLDAAYSVYVESIPAGSNRHGVYVEDISGGSQNYAIYTNAGTHRFGGALSIITTTATQLSAQYDASNRLDFAVSSAGAVTYTAVGASAAHSFANNVAVTGTLSATTRVTAPLVGTTTAVDLVFDRNSVTQLTLGSLLATFAGDVSVASGKVYKVNGTQVVGPQGAAVTDPTGGLVIDAEARTAIIAINDRLQAHGLIL
jgi:hypothetical protein